MGPAVFLDYTQEELDRAYDQFAWAPNGADVVRRYGELSARVRKQHSFATYSYGRSAAERLDVFPARARAAPMHVFVHGGAWRMLTKDDSSFLAPMFLESGAHFVAVGFGLVPQVSLPTVARQLRRAIAWLYANAASIGADRNRVYVSGHSSGAHLAGVLATTDWTAHDLPRDVIKGAVLASGMYDLRPVMLSARGSYLNLNARDERNLSPHHRVTHVSCPTVLAYGDRESPEFVRQARSFSAALTAERSDSRLVVVRGMNHFEVPFDMLRPDGDLRHATLQQMGL